MTEAPNRREDEDCPNAEVCQQHTMIERMREQYGRMVARNADNQIRRDEARDEVKRLKAKVARVEALAEELEADAERHRNAETLTVEDGARAYRAAVESAASAASIRAALAEPERDEEGGR